MRNGNEIVRLALGLLLAMGLSRVAHAETDPRDYEGFVGVPNRTAAAIFYYRHVSSSDTKNFTQDIGVLRGVYVLKFGRLAIVPFDATLPVADVTAYVPAAPGSPANLALRATGIGDMMFFPTVGYVIPEGKFNHTYFGLTAFFSFPTGQYDATHPVNVGANRYSFGQELGLGQRFLKILDFEAVFRVTEYTDNTNFIPPPAMGMMPVGGHLTHQPNYELYLHGAIDLVAHTFLAVSYYLVFNGEQRFNNTTLGVDAKAVDQQTVHTLRFTAGIRIEPNTIALLQYNQDIATTNGASISRFIGVRFTHGW